MFLIVHSMIANIKKCKFFQREREYYSKNRSIMNISSYIVIVTCFEMLQSSNRENYDAIQIINHPIFKIVLKLDQMIPQFYFTIKYKNRGPSILQEIKCGHSVRET